MKLRPYQVRAVSAVRQAWCRVRSVCLVAPTGAGKTVLGEELISDVGTVLWVAHRRELVTQTAKRLRKRFGPGNVGVVMPGEPAMPGARVQVGTVQTLLARGGLPDVHCVVLDEAHHYVAEDWRRLLDRCGHVRCLGLTATPERADGEPLGDIFEGLVVAASYSELLAEGFLVPTVVFRPRERLEGAVAQHPVDAWLEFGGGTQTIFFCRTVEEAHETARQLRDRGISAEAIESNTPEAERALTMDRFSSGETTVLTNVHVLTEGVDVPGAECVVLSRGFNHVGGFLQAAGRVLRPAPGKVRAILLDLTGATIRHGLPTEDRQYSLRGRAISEGRGGVSSAVPPSSATVAGLELEMVGADSYATTSTELGMSRRLCSAAEGEDWGRFDSLLAQLRAFRALKGQHKCLAVRQGASGQTTKRSKRAHGAGTIEYRAGHYWVRPLLPDGTRPRLRLCGEVCRCGEMSDEDASAIAAAVAESARAQAGTMRRRKRRSK